MIYIHENRADFAHVLAQALAHAPLGTVCTVQLHAPRACDPRHADTLHMWLTRVGVHTTVHMANSTSGKCASVQWHVDGQVLGKLPFFIESLVGKTSIVYPDAM